MRVDGSCFFQTKSSSIRVYSDYILAVQYLMTNGDRKMVSEKFEQKMATIALLSVKELV